MYVENPAGSIAYDGLTQTTPPTSYPVTVAQVRDHCRVLNSDSDAMIEMYLAAATEAVEAETNRQLLTATWTLKLDEFPADYAPILLPKPPLASITSVAYLDADGTSQTWAGSNYAAETSRLPGRLVPAYSTVYPATYAHPQAVTIVFVAGYGAAGYVPIRAKLAILHLAAHWFENREPIVVGNIVNEIPLHVRSLISLISVPEMR